MLILNWIALGLVVLASSGLFLSHDWRRNIFFLAIQYLGFFWLVQASWGIPLASGKLVTGWMICAILAIAHLKESEQEVDDKFWSHGGSFRLAVILMILVVTLVGALVIKDWLAMVFPAAWGGVFLIGMGFMLTGITIQPFRVVIGLLTAISGFEVIYASLESSALVTALLALVNLGLALAGAYFLTHQVEKDLS